MDYDEREERDKEFKKMFVKWKGKFCHLKFHFNPVTTIASFMLVCAVVIWIVCDDNSEAYAMDAQSWITRNFTWLYVASTMAWVVFLFVVYIRFGDLKIGITEDKPKHENFAYFAMLLTCGISSPIFYAGVSDPVRHFANKKLTTNFYSRGTTSAKAQHAMSLTLYMWGLHGFAAYTVFGLIIGILAHRKGLPLTLRTCFYPLLGRFIFGRIGDMIDTLCIASILYGISVSLIIGAKFLNSGFQIWNSDIDVSEDNQLRIIWGLTFLSTFSVISGLNIGIKKLSQLCILIGSLVCLVLITAYNTSHILNVLVQSIGYYTQFLVGLGLYTAAFEQRGLTGESIQNEINSDWMNSNTIFYWGWWISWSPFVGLFIAKISRGRTIKEVISYSFVLPTLTMFLWFVTFGSIGLDMEIEASNYNIICNMTDQNNGRNMYMDNLRNLNPSKYDTVDLLSCYDSFFRTFKMFAVFQDISQVLRVLTIIGAILLFVTSSDSASLIVDCVSSNGEEDPPVLQRVFWALCEGSVASSLLQHNQSKNTHGLQAFVVMLGFPLTVLISFCCYALWRVLKKEPKWEIELEHTWGNLLPSECTKTDCLIAIFAPWFILGRINKKLKNLNQFQKVQIFVLPAVFFYFWVLLLFLNIEYRNVDKIGWSLLIIFLCIAANCRGKIRVRYNIEGHIITDVLMMIFYPITILQMQEQMKRREETNRNPTVKEIEEIPFPRSEETRDKSINLRNGHEMIGCNNRSYEISC